MLHIHLTVKFRAGGITFGSMRREWSLPISDFKGYSPPISGSLKSKPQERELLNFSERGVTLVVGVS